MRKEGEGREEEKREEGRAKEGDERTVDAPGDANDHVVTSRSADRLHPASNERRTGSFATTTSHNTPPTQLYDVGRKNGLKPCLTPDSSRRILVLLIRVGFFLLRFAILNLATSSKLGRELSK